MRWIIAGEDSIEPIDSPYCGGTHDQQENLKIN
jgi:hypothetical protein